MHASRDVVAAYQEMMSGTLTARDYLASFRKPLAFANFALNDPMPAIVELPVAAWNHFAHGRLGTLRHTLAHKFGIAPRPIAK